MKKPEGLKRWGTMTAPQTDHLVASRGGKALFLSCTLENCPPSVSAAHIPLLIIEASFFLGWGLLALPSPASSYCPSRQTPIVLRQVSSFLVPSRASSHPFPLRGRRISLCEGLFDLHPNPSFPKMTKMTSGGKKLE